MCTVAVACDQEQHSETTQQHWQPDRTVCRADVGSSELVHRYSYGGFLLFPSTSTATHRPDPACLLACVAATVCLGRPRRCTRCQQALCSPQPATPLFEMDFLTRTGRDQICKGIRDGIHCSVKIREQFVPVP